MKTVKYMARGLLTMISIICSFAIMAYVDTIPGVLVILSLPFLTIISMVIA